MPHTPGHLVCQYCGSSLVITRRGAEPGQAPEETVVRGVQLWPFRMDDPQGTGLECFRMLVPAGWQTRGGVVWNLQNVGMPATVSLQVRDTRWNSLLNAYAWANSRGSTSSATTPTSTPTWIRTPR